MSGHENREVFTNMYKNKQFKAARSEPCRLPHEGPRRHRALRRWAGGLPLRPPEFKGATVAWGQDRDFNEFENETAYMTRKDNLGDRLADVLLIQLTVSGFQPRRRKCELLRRMMSTRSA